MLLHVTNGKVYLVLRTTHHFLKKHTEKQDLVLFTGMTGFVFFGNFLEEKTLDGICLALHNAKKKKKIQ